MIDTLTPIGSWFRERLPGGRDLTHPELAALANELADRPDLWRGLVRHDPERRFYFMLHRDRHLEAWLICWVNAQDTTLHDHDISEGAVRVVEGELGEDRLTLNGLVTDHYRAGESFAFDASRIHNVRHVGTAPATSLHLYSPPLWHMGYYETDADGRLYRRIADFTEEFPETPSS